MWLYRIIFSKGLEKILQARSNATILHNIIYNLQINIQMYTFDA